MAANGVKNMVGRTVCVVSMARTPMAAFGGSFKHLSAVDLGVSATKAALNRSKINVADVDDVYFGNVLSANLGQAPAKQVSLGAGIQPSVPCTTVNKVCASGMKAIELGAMSISLGDSEVVVVGGFESMSNVPRYANNTRFQPKPYGQKFGDFKASTDSNELDKFGGGKFIDGLAYDGLSDPFGDIDPMGSFGVLACLQNKISRQEMDDFTLRSYQLSKKAIEANKFKHEISKVDGIDLDADEEAKLRADKMTAEVLGSLKPAFRLPKKYQSWTKAQFENQTGVKFSDEEFAELQKSVTAGGSSTMSDGAASLVLASEEYCEKHGLDYLCKIKSWGQAAQIPEKFTSTPALATVKALDKVGLKPDDVDFYEVNEAFAVVPILTGKQLGVKDWDQKVNVYGGACSLGHPIGASGARITMTLISTLLNENKSIGCASICNGGGGASAIVLERNQNAPKAKL